MATAKKTALKKLPPKKAERIHTNGKTRPVRDEKGHFVGSVSVKKIKDDLMHAIEDYKPPSNKLTLKKDFSRYKQVSAHTAAGRLTVYRVYSSSAGQGSGYYFTIKQSSLNEKSEPVMTLYNPATDLIALERAIKKYKLEQE